MTQFPTILTGLSLVVLAVARTGAAQSAESLAPFLDDATVAVITVDLDRLDVAVLKEAVEAAQASDSETGEWPKYLFDRLDAITGQLRELGVSEVHGVFSLHDVTRQMPYLIVPAENEAKAQQVAAYLYSGDPNGSTSDAPQEDRAATTGLFPLSVARGNVAVCGNRRLLERLSEDRVPSRDGLQQALQATAELPLRIVSVPTPEQRRVVREFLPRLPEEWGEITGEKLAAIRWMAGGLDPGSGSLTAAVETETPEAAQALQSVLPGLLSRLTTVLLNDEAARQITAQINSLNIARDGNRLSLKADIGREAQGGFATVPFSSLSRLAETAMEIDVKHSLKELGLALHNFHDRYDSFPPPARLENDGKPMLSWRVYILPWLDQSDLYRQFHLDEPWDSPHNRELIWRMPEAFFTPHLDLNVTGKTTLMLPVDEKTAFHGKTGVPIQEITDGTSNTVMIVDAPREKAVVWTQPQDLTIDWENLKATVIGDREGAMAAFCDGSVRQLPATIPAETLRRVLMHQDGNTVRDF